MTDPGLRLLPCLALLLGALAAPAPARATPAIEPVEQLRLRPDGAGLDALDVPLGPDRLGRAMATSEFSMVGLTWSGAAGDVRIRVRSAAGWGEWRESELLDDGPDADAVEATDRSAIDLVWVGPADGIEVAVDGATPRDLRLTLLDADADAVDEAIAGRAAYRTGAGRKQKRAPKPALASRRSWGADPRLRSGRPSYVRTLQQVHVHHTVNSNDYRRSEVAGLLRGIYRYHTVNLGWSDIGYNFLVDRFGRTWVGRAGGARRAVLGAHTLGFNSTSTGVAVIGNFDQAKPRQKVLTALVRLAAWKLDRYRRDPGGSAVVFSHGSDRHPYGERVHLPVVDGHRDTNDTACPGQRLYDRLPGVRRRAAERVARF
ncbi:MAG: N-acetylmuramoyl-L-alanine amidase [Nocardioides sp.]